MATFRYSARDAQGRLQTGDIEAPSHSAVADQLQRRQLIPLQIDALPETRQLKIDVSAWFGPKVRLPELIVFARQMYSLMKAGIPMIRAIVGLADSTSSAALNTVLRDLAEQLEKGRTLSAAMAQHPKVFSRLVVSIVHVGETQVVWTSPSCNFLAILSRKWKLKGR